jgi:hypothetical protein
VKLKLEEDIVNSIFKDENEVKQAQTQPIIKSQAGTLLK